MVLTYTPPSAGFFVCLWLMNLGSHTNFYFGGDAPVRKELTKVYCYAPSWRNIVWQDLGTLNITLSTGKLAFIQKKKVLES